MAITKVETRADLVIIGSGLAGTAAAISAARSGQKVVVVSRGSGASHLSSGALDLADDPLAIAGHPEQSCRDIGQNLNQLLLRNPSHPYHLLRDGADPLGSIFNPIQEAFSQLFPAQGDYRLAGSFAQNHFALTALGTIKATAFTLEAFALAGDSCLQKPLVIGLEEYPDFDPAFWPRMAAPLLEKMDAPMTGGQSSWIRVSDVPELSAPEIARLLEDAEAGERFCAAVQNEAKEFPGLTGVLLPAVLPMQNRNQLIERLLKVTGVPARELLGWPPSVPGLRLGLHLEDRLQRSGVGLIRGSVTGFKAEGKRIKRLGLEAAGGTREIQADRFILAAGSFAGGGLRKGKSFSEPIFNLPVFCGDHRVGEIFTQKLTREVISQPHLLFTCGLKTDASLRPLGPEGEPVYENLAAAGAIIQGSDPSRDGTGAGVAIATGWRAGTL